LQILGASWIIVEGLNRFESVSKLREFFNHPRLKIKDIQLYRIQILHEPSGVVPGSFVKRTVFSWRVLNQKYLWRLGQDVSNMVTKWAIYYLENGTKTRIKDSQQEKPVPLLPLTGDYPQKVVRSDEFPSGRYRLHLTIFSSDKKMHSHNQELTLTDEIRSSG